MRTKLPISSQFGKPAGITGSMIGHIMAYRNKERIRWAIEKMGIRPNDRILEIGFGPGYAVKLISGSLNGEGSITGIDHSEVMYKQAVKKNIDGIRDGKVKLTLGDFDKSVFPENAFDRIFAINVHWFWKDQREHFKKIGKLLKDEGILYLVYQPRWAKSSEELNQITAETKSVLEDAGFIISGMEVKEMKPVNCALLRCKKK